MHLKQSISSSGAEAIGDIQFSDIFELEEIQHLQDLFADATGVASIITHPNGKPITHPSNFCRLCNDIIRKTKKGRANCYLSDAVLGKGDASGPVVVECLSGELWDAGASITVGGKHIANWLIGQVRNELLDEQRIMKYADEIGADSADFSRALSEVKVMPIEQFNKVANMLYAFSHELSEKAYNNLLLKKQISDRQKESEKMVALHQEYKKSEAIITMLAHAIRSISECVSITDMDDKIIFVNNAFLKNYLYEEHELIGNSISMVRSPNNSPAMVEEILPATMLGGWHGELVNQKKDGTEFLVFVSSSVVKDDNGVPLCLIGVSTDITARKQAEKEILSLNEELDHRVRMRTAELEAANKELESFSYSVSHDLKAPLRHITGLTDLILENKISALDVEVQEYLKNISVAAHGMGQLVDAILSFSKLNTAELRKTRIRSSEMVHKVIKYLGNEMKDRNIRLSVEPLPDMMGDEGLIRQVWTNLISNAIKYTGKKAEAIIEIGSRSTENETTFFIRDNGAGFNMKHVGKLFGVFHRLHNSKDFEGIGIGLANVNRIISRHGGHCSAEGETDAGATFYFTMATSPA